jgi:uncharacterized membrane protein
MFNVGNSLLYLYMPEPVMRVRTKKTMANLIWVPTGLVVHLYYLKLKFQLTFIKLAYLRIMPTYINQNTQTEISVRFAGKNRNTISSFYF